MYALRTYYLALVGIALPSVTRPFSFIPAFRMASLTLNTHMTNEECHRPSFECHANAVNLNIGVRERYYFLFSGTRPQCISTPVAHQF